MKPEGDVSQMSFGAGKAKAWRDIWGCGQGSGAVEAVAPAGEVVGRLGREYVAAEASLLGVFRPQAAATPARGATSIPYHADLHASVAS